MQSGITASDELTRQFNSLVSSTNLRGLIVGISNESLVPVTTIPRTGTFEEDLEHLSSFIKDDEPAYIILRRLDSGPAPFISVTYVPDFAHVRSKMLFASTKNTLIRELGSDRFSEAIFTTLREELTAQGFKKHDAHVAKAAPLTEEETALRGVKEAEAEESRGTTSRASHLSHGSPGRLSAHAEEALQRLLNTPNGLLQLLISTGSETIEVADESTCAADDLPSAISKDAPRYSVYRFTHEHQGAEENPIVFLYTCPSNSKIHERLLYASLCGAAVQVIQTSGGFKIAKRLEATDADFTESQLLEEVHPKVETKASGGFQRPKRPGRK